MVEGIKPFVNGMNAARASIAQREANAANERAEIKENGAMNAVVTVVARLNQANERISELTDANQGFAKAEKLLRARISELEGALATAKGERDLEAMDGAGRKAQFDALKLQHQSSPLFEDSDKTFHDGDPKTRIRLIYEAAFDKKGRELGIANPADRRED